MSRKTIRCSLNHNSLQSAIHQLEAYRKDIQRKNQIFVNKLAQEGIQVIQTTMESVPTEEKGSYYTEVINNGHGDIVGAAVRLSGDKVLFIEFSAGISYGTDSYPLPLALIMVLVLTQIKNTPTTQTDGGMWMKVDENIILMVTGHTCQCIMRKKLSLFRYDILQRKCLEVKHPILKYGII